MNHSLEEIHDLTHVTGGWDYKEALGTSAIMGTLGTIAGYLVAPKLHLPRAAMARFTGLSAASNAAVVDSIGQSIRSK